MSKNLSLQARLSRRDFAKGLGLIGFGGASLAGAAGIFAWSDLTLAQRGARTGSPQAFEQILPSVSGITWVHRNGRSAEMFLPETTGAGCAFFDYDNDGWMDIYLVNSGKCDFYDPRPPLRNALYHNNGNGTFTEVGHLSDIGKSMGKAWGVVAADINNDGWMDLWVANDTVPNFLFANRGKGKFEEIALQAGVGYSTDGRARSGMGVDAADYDQDGWIDLFVTNVDQEMYSFYHNNHDETFDDVAVPTHIGMVTRLMSGWGVKFFDYDNDGNIDLFIANGHPDDKIEERFSDVKYKEPLLLFHNNGKAFENVSARSGEIFADQMAARGLAIGDFNNDGAVDVLVARNNDAPLLLRNNAAKQSHWLGVKLVSKKANPDAIGALIRWQAGDLKRHLYKAGGGSYLASHDPRVVLGIGTKTKLDWVEVKWPLPSGKVERFTNLPIDQYIVLTEGEGAPVKAE